MSRSTIFACLIVALAFPARGAEPDLGFTMPKGFRATLVADETLANDIYAMTLDKKGRIVVTGQGYIKTLHDDNGDGKADRASHFAETKTGGMGLCFNGDDLLFCGDGWLSRYHDKTGDGEADGPPEHIIPLPFAEHGGHAMRKGPDGYWYIIAGNESKTGEGITLADTSLIRKPEAGRILRLSPNLRNPTVIAHGFRNPYDFDFNAQGDLFTYDSDCERDYFLPWYTPTRVYHVALGMHHGWRLTGSARSWARPGYFADSVDVLQPVGRGSPTGVACYRHDQFPEHYRGGLFILDWTFGIVYFLPLAPEGSTYKTTLERFIVPTGTSGFAPSDIEIAPDGSLLICIGGRRTRGAVYRIEAVGAGEPRPVTAVSGLDGVLRISQPLSAWSRAIWEPEAKRLGIEAFRKAIMGETRPEAERIRAVEIVTEHFGGIDPATARSSLKSASGAVRARVVWALARSQDMEMRKLVQSLASQDPDSRVRLKAMELLGDPSTGHNHELSRQSFITSTESNHQHPDKRVRQSTARLFSQRSRELWSWHASSTTVLGKMWADDGQLDRVSYEEHLACFAMDLLDGNPSRQTKLDAIRLIELGFGDFNLLRSPVEVYSGYSASRKVPVYSSFSESLKTLVFPGFSVSRKGPARSWPELTRQLALWLDADEQLADEAARLLAIIEADEPSLPARIAKFWTETSTPTRDFHYLVVFSRLKGPTTELTAKVADTILSLDRKLQGQQLRTKQVWSDRLVEVVESLIVHDPKLSDALLQHPSFVAPAHLPVASRALPAADRPKAARKFLDAIKAQGDEGQEWSGDLFDLLTLLPAAEVRPLFRARWDQLVLRDAIIRNLADRPEEVDRPKFLSGLESGEKETVEASISALMNLPRETNPENLVPIIWALRSHALDPKKSDLPKRLLALLERQAGQSFALTGSTVDAASRRKSLDPVFSWFDKTHPALAARLTMAGDVDLAAFRRRLGSIDWSHGDRDRGAKLFESRGCRTCHSGAKALGPDLGGVSQRLSRLDLFTAIAAPSLEVAPPYRTTIIETKDGRIFTGLLAFESADGVIVQTDAVNTVRIATSDMAMRRLGDASIMPTGLLKDLTDRDLVDLELYIQSLASPIARTTP